MGSTKQRKTLNGYMSVNIANEVKASLDDAAWHLRIPMSEVVRAIVTREAIRAFVARTAQGRSPAAAGGGSDAA